MRRGSSQPRNFLDGFFMKFQTITGITICCLGTMSGGWFVSHAAAETESLKVPKMQTQYRWISPTGKPIRLKWKTQSQWEWKEFKKGKRTFQKPVFRTYVEIPQKLEFKAGKGDGVDFSSEIEETPFESLNGNPIAIDSDRTTSTSNLRLVQLKKQGGQLRKKLIEIGLLVSDRTTEPVLLLHDSCLKLGIKLVPPKKARARGYSFLAAYCEEAKNDQIDVHFYTQPQARLMAQISAKHKKLKPGWDVYRVKKPSKEKERPDEENAQSKLKKEQAKKRKEPELIEEGTLLGKLKVSQSRGKAYYYLVYDPPSFKRFNGFAGLGGTYMSYSESIGTEAVSLSTVSLTLKAGANYFLTEKLDFGLSFYANVLNLTSSVTPSQYPAAQFMGVNGRVGVTLVDIPGWTLRPMFGWYYWKMFVSDKSYGISALIGPQLYLFNLFDAHDGRKWWAYLKYAPITDSFSNFNFGSREIAVGVGYPIGSKGGDLNWALTLDFSQLSIPVSVTPNAPSLMTITLGTQISF